MFYVSPEQQVKDRADFARAGIARGRSVVVSRHRDGILFVAENPSRSLHKVAELYDRIGFAAVGRYNEFESLRIAGVRHADLRGYAYDRRDVTGRMLANAYAQVLGTIFSAVSEKPYEVELAVAEVGEEPQGDQIFRLAFDGSVADEADFCVMGGSAEAIAAALGQGHDPGLPLAKALRLAWTALSADRPQPIGFDALEVALLDRQRRQPRKFRRLTAAAVADLLQPAAEPSRPKAARPRPQPPQ
jgi:proteasome alpha subunit